MGVAIYTDGGCSGNPGKGAWAFVIVDQSQRKIIASQSGFDPQTTNNRMELQAVKEALIAVRQVGIQGTLFVYTDSQYVQKGMTNWIHAWVQNNWRSKQKKVIKNVNLWQELYRVQKCLSIRWRWVRGHGEDYYNNYCHDLVTQVIKNN